MARMDEKASECAKKEVEDRQRHEALLRENQVLPFALSTLFAGVRCASCFNIRQFHALDGRDDLNGPPQTISHFKIFHLVKQRICSMLGGCAVLGRRCLQFASSCMHGTFFVNFDKSQLSF